MVPTDDFDTSCPDNVEHNQASSVHSTRGTACMIVSYIHGDCGIMHLMVV